MAPTTAHRNPSQEKHFNLIIHFKAVVNGQPLVIGKNYTNPFNETFSVEKFKFYIGNIGLADLNGRVKYSYESRDYFLIDFTDSGATTVKLSFTPGGYQNISFLLGVDSAHNVNGAQTGALDPARGMFWTWNSGYVAAKLEGRSSQSNQPGHAITYHIGGYRSPNNVAKEINLSFPKNLEIRPGEINGLNIIADVSAWFAGTYPIPIKEIPTCTTPGELAKKISDNYMKMFTEAEVYSLTN